MQALRRLPRRLLSGKLHHAKPLALIVIAFAGTGTYFLVSSHAATPTTSLNADKGTLTSCVITQSNSSASDGKYVQFGAGSGCSSGGTLTSCFASPGSCGFPDPNYAWNAASAWADGGGGVGPNNGTVATPCTSLTPSGDISTSSDGQTIQNLNIAGRITINNNNVTVNNVCVSAGDGSEFTGSAVIKILNGTNVVIKNSKIFGTATSGSGAQDWAIAPYGSGPVVMRHNSIYNCVECIHGGPFSLIDSWANNNAALGSEHAELIYTETPGGRPVVLDHDTLLAPGVPGGSAPVAVLFSNTNNGTTVPCSADITLTKSLLAGGANTLIPCANDNGSVGTSRVNISNNRFARCTTQPPGTAVPNGGTTCRGATTEDYTQSQDSHGYWANSGLRGYTGGNIYCPPTPNQTWSNNVWDNDNSPVSCG